MKLKTLHILKVAIVLAAYVCIANCEVHFMKGAPHVKLAHGGLISGTIKFSRDGRPYNSFVGIPYATIPERFHEPVPITQAASTEIFSATEPGPICPQEFFTGKQTTTEDCLNLNVYVPMNTTGPGKKGYPVMVWIHGGAFMFGNGFEYGPKYFMDEGVVLITLNYRLGAFGFLSTGDAVIPGNNGLKDVVVALRWVQENIREFGGDPKKVTIFGESAGGSAVHYLLLSPTTKGLFHRAISQSGSALNPFAFIPNPKEIAVQLATYVKCPTTAAEPAGITSEEILTCLKGLSIEELLHAQNTFKTSWPVNMQNFYFVPCAESTDATASSLTPFISQSPISILTDKSQNLTEIPWIIGIVEDEGAWFSDLVLQAPQLIEQINENWDTLAPMVAHYDRYPSDLTIDEINQKLKQFYFGDKTISLESRAELTNFFSDELFVHGILRSALETSSRGKRNQVYLYQFTYRSPLVYAAVFFNISEESKKMVQHADEVLMQFDIVGVTDRLGGLKQDSPEEQISKHFVRLWTSFAANGEPKHTWGNAVYKKWKSISKREQVGLDALRWYKIAEDPQSFEIVHDTMERIRLWDEIRISKSPVAATQEPAASSENVKTEL